MRWLRSLTAVGLLVGLAVLVPAAPACACSCPAVTAEEAVENAGVVFAGTVVAVDVPWRWLAVSGADPVTVTFEVGTVYKGAAPINARLQTARDGASCGYDFTPGSRYLVHVLIDQEGTWTTNACDGNRRLPAGTALPPSGYAPLPAVTHPGTWPGPVLILGAALAAGAVVAVLLVLGSRRRRRAATGPA
jgi:hypothetical protein